MCRPLSSQVMAKLAGPQVSTLGDTGMAVRHGAGIPGFLPQDC